MLPSTRVLQHTVQSFPPKNAVGAGPLVYELVRGPILPPRGTKERDRVLRLYDANDYNSLWMGARSGIVKKLSNVSYTIEGPRAKAQYYQDLLGYAHFGHGWAYMLKRVLRDFLTQSYGGIFEIAGPGDPDMPLLTTPTSINHLDAGRCYVTGNPIYPLLYYSLWDGRLHKMHASRIFMMVDDPNPDERYLGIGTCALERAIAVAQREMRMGQYLDVMMDDKPQPGILSLKGVTDPQWQQLLSKYIADIDSDQLNVFGRTIVLTSIDPTADVKAEPIPFAQTPEKFDFIKYVDLDVSACALALGVDRQELWELAGRSLGSGSQSAVLAMKSRAKMYGDVLTALEWFMNFGVLDEDCEFQFIEHDAQQDVTQTSIDLQLAQLAQTMAAIPGITPGEIKTLLANRSDTFKDALTNDMGQVTVGSADPQTPGQVQQDAALEGDTPLNAPGGAITPASPKALIPASGQLAARAAMKAFSATSADFRNRFTSVLDRAVAGSMRRQQAESVMLSLLTSSGEKAYTDGLRQGGVNEPLDDDERATVLSWVSDQIDYLDPLLDAAFGKALSPDQIVARSDMWVNKALGQMFNAGRLSADANGMYMFAGTDGKENCRTCKRLKGQIHRLKDWDRARLIPGQYTDTFECGGWQCKHTLKRVKGAAIGQLKAFDPAQPRADNGEWSETGAGGGGPRVKPGKPMDKRPMSTSDRPVSTEQDETVGTQRYSSSAMTLADGKTHTVSFPEQPGINDVGAPRKITGLSKFERQSAALKIEHGALYDQHGNVVASSKGIRGSVSMHADDFAKAGGGVFTHNHPSGGSFSAGDFDTMAKSKVGEFRASVKGSIFGDGTFSMKRTGAAANPNVDVGAVTRAAYAEAQKKYPQHKFRTAMGTGVDDNAMRHIWTHEANKITAKTLGFTYEFQATQKSPARFKFGGKEYR